MVELLHYPESVILVAIVEGLQLVAVRQTRPGAPEPTLELPSGKLEAGESPAEAAARELGEECGLAAATFTPLGSFWVVPAYSTERAHVFEATDLSPVRRAPDEDEDIEVEHVSLAEAWRRLSDGGSLGALALWQNRPEVCAGRDDRIRAT